MGAFRANGDARLDRSEALGFADTSRSRKGFDSFGENRPLKLGQRNPRGSRQFATALAHLFQRSQH
jgi:hypothetical protein